MLRKIMGVSLLGILSAAAVPHEAEAQRRAVPRSPHRRVVVFAARPYYPVYYSPFFAGWYGGWYGPAWHAWYPHRFYGQYYPPYGYRYEPTGAARIDVKPREAEVYLDGYLVGTVDDFDGWLQRLHVPYGEHEIQIYLPGHRSIREKVLFRPGATLTITGSLESLGPGEPEEPRPTPAVGATRPANRGYPPEGRPREGSSRRGEQPAPDDFGSVAIRVQPADAEVLIDGERWDAPEGGDRLIVQLGEGEHRIEIRKQGYRTYSTSIRLRRGETIPLNVSLSRQEGI